MIEKDFKVDFKSKKIGYNSKGSGETYTVNKLYSLIMGLLDEPENMKYDIPVESVAKGEFRLAEGWTINEKAKKHLKGGTLKTA